MATVVKSATAAVRRPSRGRAKANPAAAEARSSSAPGRGRPQAEAKRSSSLPVRGQGAAASGKGRGKGGWVHPEGVRLEDLDTSVPLSGVIVNVANFGVFVDVGAERNAILRCPARYWRGFRRGDLLRNLTVQQLNLANGRLAVTLEDPEAAIEANRVPLEELQEGMHVDGVVDNKNQFGVFVNIRSTICHGRLRAPRSVLQGIVRGQVLRDLVIDRVDLENRRVAVSMDDPQAALREFELVSLEAVSSFRDAKVGAKPKAKAKAKPRVKAKARATEPSPAAAVAEGDMLLKASLPERQTRTKAAAKAATKAVAVLQEQVLVEKTAKVMKPVREEKVVKAEDLQIPLLVGDLVDGMVTGIGTRGVHVDIGLSKPAILMVSPELKKEFQKGDKVQGMTVEEVGKLGTVTLSMEDPELQCGGDQLQAQPAVQQDRELPEVGDMLDGIVTKIGTRGVLVDIGLSKPGLLLVSPELKEEFQKGDRVQGMLVDKVSEQGRVTLSMEDPELQCDQAEARGKLKADAKPKAKVKVQGKAKVAKTAMDY